MLSADRRTDKQNSKVRTDLVLQGDCSPSLLKRAVIASKSGSVRRHLANDGAVWRCQDASSGAEFDAIKPQLAEARIDYAFVPSDLRLGSFSLLVFDMDSTLITIECIDELADFADKKKEVAEITATAMRGELDYSESLKQRLALLAGLPVSVLEQVYSQRLQLTSGARELLASAKLAGLRTAIISGGFTYFSQRLATELSLDYSVSNILAIEKGKLTGKVVGELVDASAKMRHLQRLQTELAITSEQCIAIGDGANDRLMLQAAGFSVAFHAKPVLSEATTVAIRYGSLARLLPLFQTV